MVDQLRGNKAKVIEIDGKTIGREGGDTCNRLIDAGEHGPYMCDGTIKFEYDEGLGGCSCHVCAPCGYCTSSFLVCSDCGAEPEEE